MGVVCTSCNRKRDDKQDDFFYTDQKMELISPKADTSKLIMIFENGQDKEKIIQNAAKKPNNLTLIVNSASNYWKHREKMSLCGSHKPLSTYTLETLPKILRFGKSVATLQEYLAVRKIERCYLRYKSTKHNSGRSSREALILYENLFESERTQRTDP